MNKRLFVLLGVVALLSMSGCALFTGIDDPDCWPYGRIVVGDLSSDCRWPEGGDGAGGDGAGDAGPAAGDSGPAAGDSGEGEGDSGEGDSGEGEGEGEGQGDY